MWGTKKREQKVRAIESTPLRDSYVVWLCHTVSPITLMSHHVQCCLTSTETIKTIRDEETRTSTSTFTQLLSSDMMVQFQCCFTSTFTQLMSSGWLNFNIALRSQRP